MNECWKKAIANNFPGKITPEGDELDVTIDLSDPVGTAASIVCFCGAMLEFYEKELILPDDLRAALERTRSAASDVHWYLVDEGDFA